MLNLKILGDKTVIDRLDHILYGKRSKFGQALNKVAISVQDAAKEGFAGGGDWEMAEAGQLRARSGRLRSSITHLVDQAALHAFVGTNVIYAPVHEFGATITPKRAKMLAWIHGRKKQTPPSKAEWQRAHAMGTARFAKRVIIPKRPFLGPALEGQRDNISKLFAYEIDKLLDGK